MGYRMDWRVTLRAVKREDTATLIAQLGDIFGEAVAVHGNWPAHNFYACRNCAFSTSDWEISFPEAVVQSIRLAQRIGKVWQFSLQGDSADTLTGFFTDEQNSDRMYGIARATFTLVPATAPLPVMPRVPDIILPKHLSYRVIIHAEAWEAPIPDDAVSIVNVIFNNGDCWAANFYTLRSIETYIRPQLYPPGNYYWESGMVLIKTLTRPAVEATIAAMIKEGLFQQAFMWLTRDEELAVENDLD